MKEKTALHQLIEKLEEKRKTPNLNDLADIGIICAISEAEFLLETEKRQIKDAFIEGSGELLKETHASEYFTEKYQQS